MGFTKAKYAAEVAIALTYRLVDHDKGTDETATCIHYFRLPTATERTNYEQQRVQVKGRKVKSFRASANWWLWERCCQRVEGYDDLQQDDNWRKYFTDDKGRIHVDEFTEAFLERIMGEEADVEKKSVPSSEQ
jgi:hypothetical protein